MKLRLAVLAILLAVPGLLFAGTSCATPTVAPADSRIVDFDFVGISADNFYQFDATAGHSYSIEVRQDYDDLQPTNDLATSVFSVADTGCATPLAVNGTVLRDTSLIEPALPANSFRASMTAANTGTYRLRVRNSNPAVGRYVSVKISETTMYSASFSTNQPFNTFYAFVNTTSSPITGTLTLTPLGGGGPVPITITIPANALASTNTSVPVFATVVNKVGFATFSHNGPPGAVLISAAIANFTTNPAYNQVIEFRSVREHQ